MAKHNTAAFWIVLLYTACGSNGVRKNQLYQITKIAVDILEGQMTLWATIERSTTSCCAKCLLQEECFLSVYFPNRTCIGYGRLWVMLTKTHVDESHADAYAMIRTVESVQCPENSFYVETAGNCVKLSRTEEKWNNALEKCRAIGCTLAEIGSEEEDKLIAKFLSVQYEDIISIVWLGATSDGDEWTWAGSRSRVEYTNWYIYPEAKCAAMVQTPTINAWMAYRCDMSYKYVCEKQTVE
ncbi:hypothetical protein ScPMuIL_009068 [Solemya velum]